MFNFRMFNFCHLSKQVAKIFNAENFQIYGIPLLNGIAWAMNLGGCESRETRRWGETVSWKWVAKDKKKV